MCWTLVSRKRLVATASRCKRAGKRSVTFAERRSDAVNERWRLLWKRKRRRERYEFRDDVVEVTGFEPATFWSRTTSKLASGRILLYSVLFRWSICFFVLGFSVLLSVFLLSSPRVSPNGAHAGGWLSVLLWLLYVFFSVILVINVIR